MWKKIRGLRFGLNRSPYYHYFEYNRNGVYLRREYPSCSDPTKTRLIFLEELNKKLREYKIKIILNEEHI